jgi:hypothetical protein
VNARTLGWLLVGGLVLAVFMMGGPAQAWAKATTWLSNQPSVSSVTGSFTNTGVQGSEQGDTGPEDGP